MLSVTLQTIIPPHFFQVSCYRR